MHAAGVSLAGFKVSINEPYAFNLNLSQDQLSGLGEVAKTLKVFEFDLDESQSQGPDPEGDLEKLEGFCSYLSAAIGRQGVPRLSLMVDPPENFFTIGPLLTSPSWERLRLANFSSISMTIRDLRRLVGMLQPGVCLRLEAITLTTGTWAEALDCLRTKVCWGSYLVDPRGAEADEMDHEEKAWSDVFGNEYRPYDPISNATLYITSKIHKNPLHSHFRATE